MAERRDVPPLRRGQAGRQEGDKKGRGFRHKHKVLSLVDRTTGRAKSMVVDHLRSSTLLPILRENLAKEAVVYTDEAGQYSSLGKPFAAHDFVRHSAGEHGRGEVHTSTIEDYFSIFKRGMKGIYRIAGRINFTATSLSSSSAATTGLPTASETPNAPTLH